VIGDGVSTQRFKCSSSLLCAMSCDRDCYTTALETTPCDTKVRLLLFRRLSDTAPMARWLSRRSSKTRVTWEHFSRVEARYSLTAPGSTIEMLDRERTCAMKNRMRRVRACRSSNRVRYGLPTCQRGEREHRGDGPLFSLYF
jgi:hypothetical protein